MSHENAAGNELEVGRINKKECRAHKHIDKPEQVATSTDGAAAAMNSLSVGCKQTIQAQHVA